MKYERMEEILKDTRKKRNMTQEELGDIVGVGGHAISSYENGTRVPAVSIMMSIARALNVSLECLCGLTDIKNSFLIPQDVDFKTHKLNAAGIKELSDYCDYLCTKKEYSI